MSTLVFDYQFLYNPGGGASITGGMSVGMKGVLVLAPQMRKW